ncbi:MAG: CGNR zinc finger domain-containing protein [Terriglobales bacterium]
MSQAINLPVVFKFMKFPVRWTVQTVAPGTTFALTRLVGIVDKKASQQIDGWKSRQEFLRLHEDNQSLCGFMNSVGLFETGVAHPSQLVREYHVDENRSIGLPEKIFLDPDRVWFFRRHLIQELASQKMFIERWASEGAGPKSGLIPEFSFRFKMDSRKAAGVVTTASLWEMLLVTIYVDLARGFRFRACQRPDCPEQVFVAQTGHKRKYCSQQCGHLESVRAQRAYARKKRGVKP